MTVKQLFNSLHLGDENQNPFETPDTNSKFESLCEMLSIDTQGRLALMELISLERETAFAVGYRTAFSLMMEGIREEAR